MEHTHAIALPSHTRAVREEECKGTYEIDALYPGYGNTLGNSLRRILLSSLVGSAITRVKIEGINHEFSTAEHVVEDAIILLLNFKQLRFRMHGDGPYTATIDVKGAREVKGKDVTCPSQLEVINKDHHIATLTHKNARFIAELTVEHGIGFVPAEQLSREKVPVGTMVLDAIFSPLRRVNYEVENMRVGDRTDYNRLRLTIETDGSLTPREAYLRSLAIMREHIDRIANFGTEDEDSNLAQKTASEEKLESAALAGLPLRIQNVLIEQGITTFEDLAKKTEGEVLSLEGIGEKALGDIKKVLRKEGFSLRSED